jgi:hypothetical protein
MSDEIKKEQSAELVEPAPAQAAGELSESALEQVAGGSKAAPILATACVTGKHIAKVTIAF